MNWSKNRAPGQLFGYCCDCNLWVGSSRGRVVDHNRPSFTACAGTEIRADPAAWPYSGQWRWRRPVAEAHRPECVPRIVELSCGHMVTVRTDKPRATRRCRSCHQVATESGVA